MVTATASIPGFCRIGAVRFIRRISHHQTFRCSTSTPHPLTNDTIQNPSSTKSNHDDASVSANTPSSFFPKKNQTLELECESLAFKGKGVCKVSGTGFVVMCDRALPGERFIGRVTRKKGSYAEVVKLKTLVPHHDLVEAPCEYASDCGGCKMQNLLYEAQVRYKEQQVQELLVHVGRFTKENLEFNPIVPCSIQYHYRNKMEFSFCTDKWLPKDEMIAKEEKRGSNIRNGNDYALGLHVPGFFDKVIQIDKCLLQSEAADKVLTVIQDGWRSQRLDLSPYNVHTHKGFLKHLMLRSGRNVTTGSVEVMVNFVTSSYKPELLSLLVEKISLFPEVVSVVNNVNTSIGNTSVGEEEYILYGKSTITETLRGLTFQISANSFFQTNTHQAEILYKLIEDYAGLRGDGSEIILDLFCGTGTIGLTLAKRVKEVYGYEVVADAISDARRNAMINNISNAIFVQGDLNKISDNFGNDFPKPNVVISDPNRPGMHTKLIKFLLKLRSPRIVYVSCNPSTCARDLDYLCHGVMEKNLEGCYKLTRIQPVDMFPHTPHIECVCLLELC
ncbi:23S rRNA (Uracil-5-)-methyltransferase [Zostera marina]|uniref:23S rRNA (Uracil-5-)-methyltransferase n=1 Tax=Zostera marina TaxID=29655 RepID=A0A0K9NR23_ZOSMR|nr:23S rRNA (Uracil-5-)-methyltransferase [Zostera marina]